MTSSIAQVRYPRNSGMEDRPGEVIFLNEYAKGPTMKGNFQHRGSMCILQEPLWGDREKMHNP